MSPFYWINTSLVVIIIVMMTIFIAVYSQQARWWETRIGRNLVISYASIAIYMTSIAIDTAIPDNSITFALARTVALSTLLYTVIDRIRLMLAAQKQGEREKSSKTEPTVEKPY